MGVSASRLYPDARTSRSADTTSFSWEYVPAVAGEELAASQLTFEFVDSTNSVVGSKTVKVSSGASVYEGKLATLAGSKAKLAAATAFRWTVACSSDGTVFGDPSDVTFVSLADMPTVSFPSATILASGAEAVVSFTVEGADEFLTTQILVTGGVDRDPTVDKLSETSYRLSELENGVEYSVLVTASNGLLEGSGACKVKAAYSAVVPPVLSFEHRPELGALEITVKAGTGTGVVADYYVVERSIDGGDTWQAVASFLKDGESVLDYECAVVGQNLYQAWGVGTV